MTAKEYEKKLEEVRLKLATGEKLTRVEERIWAYRNVGRCACSVSYVTHRGESRQDAT